MKKKSTAQTSSKTAKSTMWTSDTMMKTLGFVALGAILGAGVISAFQNTTTARYRAQTQQETSSYGPMGYGRNDGFMMMGNYDNTSGSYQRSQNQQGTGLNRNTCLMDGCLLVEDSEYPVADLDEQTIEYLNLALEDERKALKTYETAMEDFGRGRPFVNIARAEEQHISMLLALFDKYGVEIPTDKSMAPNLPATMTEVCQLGVEAEIANDALYQEMIPNVEQEDIAAIFTSLANASKTMHLPAFERCAQ